MISTESDYRAVLRRELEVRCQKTPRYSLRAFARDLKISPSRLSEVLGGKQGLSQEAAKGIAKSLALSETESRIFCDLVESRHARGKVNRELAKARLEKEKLDHSFHGVQLDAFQAVSDWYHYAILQLACLPGFKSDILWISKALGISAVETTAAIQRLQRLNLIRVNKKKIEVLQEYVSTKDVSSSAAIRKFHRQVLERALIALDTQPLEERSFSVVMMPIDQAKMEDAKRWLRRFRRRFCKKINESERKTDVYCLSMQFFNLTHSLRARAETI